VQQEALLAERVQLSLNDPTKPDQNDKPIYGADGTRLIDGAVHKELKEAARERDRDTRRQNLQLWFNGVLAVTTVLLFGVGGYQSYVSKRSADASTVAAQAAQRAAGIAERTLAEIHTGGYDTHALAVAAGNQAAATRDLSANAIMQASATNRLAFEARRSADLAQKQQMPWLGIVDSTLLGISSPTFTWVPTIQYPTIWTTISFSLKNYGPTPALKGGFFFTVTPMAERPRDQETAIDACEIAQSHEPATEAGQIGHVILPNAMLRVEHSSGVAYTSMKVRHLTRAWVDVCIAYQDQAASWHHSKYRYVAGAPDAKPVIIEDHPGWSYVPFSVFNLISASVD
jgi:hypothetical protein